MKENTKTSQGHTLVQETEQPALAFDWGAIKWLCNQEIDAKAEQTFGLVFINPRQQNPPHYHPNCEELIYILSGQCDHRLDDEVIPMGPGSLLRIPANAVHCALNTGWEPVRMVIVYSSADRQTVFLDDAKSSP
jgi:quercetin dioxygenase-like cupin family protein